MLKISYREDPKRGWEWVVMDFETHIVQSTHKTKEEAEKAAGLAKPKRRKKAK